MKFAIVYSDYYGDVGAGLLAGACGFLASMGCPVAQEAIFKAPGAFEIPLIAKRVGHDFDYNGVITLGCVIQGETPHFDYICEAVASGLMAVTLEIGKPIAFGVLTVMDEAQAHARSLPGVNNKGFEAAKACYESACLLQQLQDF